MAGPWQGAMWQARDRQIVTPCSVRLNIYSVGYEEERDIGKNMRKRWGKGEERSHGSNYFSGRETEKGGTQIES